MFGFFKKKKEAIDINGYWKGFYKYIGLPNMKDVIFVAYISENNKNVSGIIREEVPFGGISDVAKIDGQLKDNELIFIKKYPCFCWLDEQGMLRKEPEMESQEILHKGSFDNKENKFWGTWETEGSFVMNNQPVKVNLSGYWEMRKHVE